MTLEEFAYIADIIGVVLVIASLIYVAQQLRQNNEMMRAESRNEIQHSKQQEIFMLLQNPDVWRGLVSEKLDDESIRLTLWLTASFRAREHEWFQFRSGVLDEAAWNSYSTAIPIVLANERPRAWWGVTKQIYNKEFVAVVDELLENKSINAIGKNQTIAMSGVTKP